ncbi:MAG: acyl carrier protein [Bacteroidales bacterium]|nr:acyl carrier protein [Bacteroidales bacterium]
MDLEKFLADFADIFDETDASEIKADTQFHYLDEWSSMSGMAVIAIVKSIYGKEITGEDIKKCDTVNDLFELVKNK